MKFLAVLAIGFTLSSFANSNIEKPAPDLQKYQLTIQVEKVKHIYGCVGDHVNHWFQIGDDLYDTWNTVNLNVSSQDRINLISTSCDCNEKLVDRDDENLSVLVGNMEQGINRFQVTTLLHERNGKYAGNSAEYQFHYKITLN